MIAEDRKLANALWGVLKREAPRLIAEAVEVARLDPRERRNRRMAAYMRSYRARRRAQASEATA